MGLTAKEEAYCQERANGKIQHDSHIIAYPKSLKWKKGAIDAGASRIEAKPHIKARIKELKKPTQDLLEENRNKIIQELIDVGLKDKEVKTTTVTALTNLAGKLLPTKTETKSEVAHTFNIKFDV